MQLSISNASNDHVGAVLLPGRGFTNFGAQLADVVVGGIESVSSFEFGAQCNLEKFRGWKVATLQFVVEIVGEVDLQPWHTSNCTPARRGWQAPAERNLSGADERDQFGSRRNTRGEFATIVVTCGADVTSGRRSLEASSPGSALPQALAWFRSTNPGVRVTLSQLETEPCYARILRGDLDLAITFDYRLAPFTAPPEVKRTLIAEDPMLVALPVGHRLAASDTIELSDLADEAWIGTPVTGLHSELLAELSRTAGFQPPLQFDGDDFQTVLSLVANDLGIALLPRLALRRAPAGVIARPIADESLTRFTYTARLQGHHPHFALSALAQDLERSIAGDPAIDARE